MTPRTIAILSPGDMGHAVGRTLREAGLDVVTCLAGRSVQTRGLAEKAGLRDLADLESVVREAGLVLSILPPEAATANARAVAEAMRGTGASPIFADCNAVSPDTAKAIAEVIEGAGAPFIDAGIIGAAPGRGVATRFYVSGPDTSAMEWIAGAEILVNPLGPEIGRASAIKMCYAALTKGTFTLQTAVLIVAEALGLGEELTEEFRFSQQPALERMQAMVPRIPADSARWIGEMQEIQKTFASAGVTPAFHQGAEWLFELLSRTPFAEETRETIDASRTLEESVRVYTAQLSAKP
jgi:3-hydroxyisobutyrate dehydrogenase-like beta-hydroxyacid dehydrogenase